jgi:hypothetical protein
VGRRCVFCGLTASGTRTIATSETPPWPTAKYDAAVADRKDGEPHIVKRVDRPAVRVIPEWLGAGTLARRELHDAARALDAAKRRSS